LLHGRPQLLELSPATQRAAWANGDKTGFFPYGKTQPQVFAKPD